MTLIPAGGALHPLAPAACFVHRASITLPPPRPPPQACLGMAVPTPRWMDALMALRSRAMRLAGMRNLGRIADVGAPAACRPGDRVGSVTVLRSDAGQIARGDSDRHLDVRLSLQLEAAPSGSRLHCVTVVERPNPFGRRYRLPVAPLHRVTAPLLLRRYAHRLREDATVHHRAGNGPSSGST